MGNALTYVVRTLFDLYLLTFALRLLLQFARADARNPLVQFVIRVTNPLVLPLRRVLPPFRRIDTATLVALLVLQMVATALVLYLACGTFGAGGPVLGLALLETARLFLRIVFWAILIYVVLSWVSPGGYNPGARLVAGVVEPLLAPFRRVIPLIGGLDLSPVFAVIAIQAVEMLLPSGSALTGLACAGGLAGAL